jgi:nucleotide-binding universal stress UspA family protein
LERVLEALEDQRLTPLGRDGCPDADGARARTTAGIPLAMRAIVVGFDGSPAAERALDRVAEFAGDHDRVVVVTASTELESTRFVDEPILDSPSPEERDALLDQGAQALRTRGIEPQLIAADGEPAQELVQAALASDAHLIVVGSTGSGYVTRAILGSTAQSVLRQAPCDVLVVR